jgi:hypothetical protein
MIESENNDIPQLSSEENRILTANFTEKKVHVAIMQMEKTKRWVQMVSQGNSIKSFGM